MKDYKLYISSEEIETKVRELAQQISVDYEGRKPLLITLLKGAFIFLSDLVRNLTIPHEIDFIALSSYREGSKRSGEVKIINTLSRTIEDRDVIIIDEIVDTGHTLSNLIKSIDFKSVRSIKICTLLDKRSCREVDIPIDYYGFRIPGVFVVGYGLDFMDHYRSLSYITELTPDFMMPGGAFEAGFANQAPNAGKNMHVPAVIAGGVKPVSAGKRLDKTGMNKPDS